MKTEHGFKGDLDEFADSPLPSFRNGSAGARIDMSFRSDSSSPFDEFEDVASGTDTDEGRLSRALQTWRPDHVLKPLYPREKPPIEPVFSGRLGKEKPVPKRINHTKTKNVKSKLGERRAKTAPLRRTTSEESLATNISLLSCSSAGSNHQQSVIKVTEDTGNRRRKRKVTSRASTQTSEHGVSVWMELSCKRTGGILSSLNKALAVRTDYGLICGGDDDGESEAFKLFEKDEQKAVYNAGWTTGIKYVNRRELVRSASTQNLTQQTHNKTQSACALKRVLSANAKKGFGKPLDIAELKRERMNRLEAIEQARLLQERERRKGRRGGMSRKLSANTLGSSASGSMVSPPGTTVPSVSALSQSGHSSEIRPFSPSANSDRSTTQDKERVAVWKGDREILEIDLKKELTQRVQKRISTTRTALRRATGLGDSNEQTQCVGKVEEFPQHVEEDFCHKPRIIQRMRISPHLSDVIHDDIQVRMGRPRYHEIRLSDLEQWNKGQSLDRAHRNLKVFNWLHSLKESEFRSNFDKEIPDEIPDIEMDLELLHVESADEPDVKPLYRAYEVRIL